MAVLGANEERVLNLEEAVEIIETNFKNGDCFLWPIDLELYDLSDFLEVTKLKRKILAFTSKKTFKNHFSRLVFLQPMIENRRQEFELVYVEEKALPEIYNIWNSLVFKQIYVCVRESEIENVTKNQNFYVGIRGDIKYYKLQKALLNIEKYSNGVTIVKASEPLYCDWLMDVSSINLENNVENNLEGKQLQLVDITGLTLREIFEMVRNHIC